ncbi:MAG: COG4705 family protein [Pyrinomonadaceae bacterium]
METINRNESLLNKVAQITLLFWLMKIVATTLGETLGDFISMTLGLGYSVGIAITLAFFLVVLAAQLFLKKYVPAVYWLVIVGTTTLGTEISDFIDRSLGLGYALGSVLLVGGLFLTLFIWYQKYKSLEVYPIFERQKEVYFWIAVLFSNSLGTAFGDFLSDNLELSYLAGALICGAVILIVVLLHYYTKINEIVLFWIAFIFTRPFGATFGDFLTKPHESGGLELGTLPSSLISITLMIILIVVSHSQQRKSAVE